jgi:glyoxylase-like metal-dependent hydrolase (beta-lactamase superfamily II)
MLTANVVDGVHRVEDAYTNWYLVEGDGGMTVVDAGVPSSWQSFQDALRQLGRRPDDVKAVVLTHGHFDHIGFAERARRELGVPVWVHEHDVLLTRKPLQYGRERSPLRYILTRPKALPVVGSFLRHRAYFPTPVKSVALLGRRARRSRAAARRLHSRPHPRPLRASLARPGRADRG